MNIKKPIFSDFTEKVILSKLINDDNLREYIFDNINFDDFFLSSNQKFYIESKKLYIKYNNINTEKLYEILSGKISEENFNNIINSNVSEKEFYLNVEEFKKLSSKRKMVEKCQDILEVCYDNNFNSNVEDFALGQFMNAESKNIGFKTTKDIVDGVLEDIKLAEQNNGIVGIQTGFEKYDEFIGGLQSGQIYVIAARPSLGKTSLLLSFLDNILTKEYHGVLYSLESSYKAIGRRQLSIKSGVELSVIKSGIRNKRLFNKFGEAIDGYLKYNFLLNEETQINTNKILSNCRKLKQNKMLDLILIDYIQLMNSIKNYRGNKNNEVGEISRALKEISIELDVPLIYLSQLSRAVENRTSKRPILSDLRDSGQLEQDADVITFIYRPEEKEYKPHKNYLELIIAKNRDGKIGRIPIEFIPENTKFQDFDKDLNIELIDLNKKEENNNSFNNSGWDL
jgi:replicative DNA helicase